MQNRIANAVAIAYVGFVAYLVTDPWHEEIGDYLTDKKREIVDTWSFGLFYMQAKIDLILITER